MQYANGYIFDAGYSRMYSPRMNANKTIGDRLDEAMKPKFGSNQSELSRASDVPQATISRILKGGGKKGPETETIRKLASACGVSFEWLIEGINHLGRSIGPEQSTHHESANDDSVSANELVELINAYLEAAPKDRALLMSSAKAAAKRAARKKRGRPTGNEG